MSGKALTRYLWVGQIAEDPQGTLVSFADYAALRASHEALVATLINCCNRLRNQGGDIKPLTEQLNWAAVKDAEAALTFAKETAP